MSKATEALCGKQPIARVEWVHRDTLIPNDYNPNHVAPNEMDLLRVSIMRSGWTQPIVVLDDGCTIIDGFHRWTISAHPEVFAMTNGYVPVVRSSHSEAERVAATVRHNRARGSHGIDPMSAIVRRLSESGMSDAKIQETLGMEQEEIDRLREVRGLPQVVTERKVTLGKSWRPKDSIRTRERAEAPVGPGPLPGSIGAPPPEALKP